MRRLWPVLLVAACTAPTIPSGAYPTVVTPAIEAGHLRAVACMQQEHLVPIQSYRRLRLWLDPDTELGGHTHGRDVFVQARLAAVSILWAHEFLHALSGLPGNAAIDHPPAFWRCGLDPRQF